MKKCGKHGFTLIEVLISILILSLTISTIAILFGEVTKIMEKNVSTIPKNFVNMWKLKNSLESIETFVIMKNGKFEEFFSSNNSSLIYVSNYSITGIQTPVLCKILFKNQKLIAKELPIYSKNIDYLSLNPLDFSNSKSFTLLSSVKKVKFEISFKEKSKMPQYIRILIKPTLQKKIELMVKIQAYDPQRLPSAVIIYNLVNNP